MKLIGSIVRVALCVTAAAATLPASAQSNTAPTPRVIVKWRKDTAALNDRRITPAAALDNVRARFGIGMTSLRTNAVGGEVFRLDRPFLSSTDVDALVAELKRDPTVEYAEPDALLGPLSTPSDPLYNQQWHYYETTAGLNLPAAWDVSTGSGIRVAVIDTGYRPHADLSANLVGGYDFVSDTFIANDGGGRDSDPRDPGDFTTAGACNATWPGANSSWHGTHVAGTIAAVTNNGVGVAGVAYNAKVVPVRVLGRCGGLTSDIADAIAWASGGSVYGVPTNANPARVISLSLGGSGACSTTLQNAINTARARGSVVVVAAGNSNTNASNTNPANCSGVVTVAAVGRTGGRASYSNYGSMVDVAAPGGDFKGVAANGVLSTMNSGTSSPGSDVFAYYQGTSMATPHVSGVAALILARRPTLTPSQVEMILKATTRPFPATCSQCGTGIVDASAAVRSNLQ